MPNPATDMIRVEILSSKVQDIDVQLFDGQGNIVGNQSTTLNEGSTFVELNISELPGGIYYVFVPTGFRKNAQIKFIKTRM